MQAAKRLLHAFARCGIGVSPTLCQNTDSIEAIAAKLALLSMLLVSVRPAALMPA